MNYTFRDIKNKIRHLLHNLWPPSTQVKEAEATGDFVTLQNCPGSPMFIFAGTLEISERNENGPVPVIRSKKNT